MIVYNKTKENFSNDILTNDIGNIISSHIFEKTGKRIAKNEFRAFENSLGFMERVLNDNEIPEDCGISIEYHIPQTSKRVDLIISGLDENNNDKLIIVELKQWQKAELTDKDGIIKTKFQYGESETSHPSYQAWSYTALLNSFNSTIEEDNIELHPCAYLHNYVPDEVITNDFYKKYIEKAPVFLKPDALKLREFIKKFIKKGDRSNILYRVDNGKIRPTKLLAEVLDKIFEGKPEFILIDDQKIVYENALNLALKSNEKHKNVLIVEGGPGTGKTVVAINLLVELNRRCLLAQYVTKTLAPREVYFDKLAGTKRKTELKNLFIGSGSFINTPKNSISALIVDEAHRITEKTGFLKRGNNQIKEILNSSLFTVFFIDEDQRVHIDDYGEIYRIEEIAKELKIQTHRLKLESQFRCNGSDGYLSWVNNVLQIRDTANDNLENLDFEFDFKVFDNPKELQQAIFEKNELKNKARLTAGYCWEWKSKNNLKEYDIEFPEYDFKMKWNLGTDGGKWIIAPKSVNEIGCIHTAQGLETDYVGVIVGEDLIIRNGKVLVDPSKRAKGDRSIFGWKKLMENNPDHATPLLKAIIKNTYRTLLTRGMKGCYIYCVDKETNEYFKKQIGY